MNGDPVTVLRRAFGHPAFRPGQEPLVRAVLGGRDALGVLPTGGGKSVCYQVPAMMLPGLTLVVTPLISLMEDQVGRARDVGLSAACLSGTQSAALRRRIAGKVFDGRVAVLFVSPERLRVESFLTLLDRTPVSLIAVDEAHCISEWGHDFRPSYRAIGRVRARLRCPVLALTASATPEVRSDIAANLQLRRPVIVVRSFDRPNLRWAVAGGGQASQRLPAVRAAVRGSRGVSIVYAPTRRAVEMVRDYLAARGNPCDAYHAGLPGEERTRVQKRFMSGKSRLVAATNAFGMGIDKSDVRAVVHLQMPATLESYYQEAGRAGRDGRPAVCIAFHGSRDARLARGFIDRTHPAPRTLRRVHRALVRLADGDGVVSPDDPRLVRALGSSAEDWLAGEPVGVLGALERIGGIARLSPPQARAGGGTPGPGAGSVQGDRIGVRRRLDTDAAVRLRGRAAAKLRAVQRFARSRGCRRTALLRYFGEMSAESCGRCDRCGWDYRANSLP